MSRCQQCGNESTSDHKCEIEAAEKTIDQIIREMVERDIEERREWLIEYESWRDKWRR